MSFTDFQSARAADTRRWADTVVLDGGRVALVVGDVVGHGVGASAVTGQLRTVVQERLRAGGSPPETLRAVDAHARHIPGGAAATCRVAVLDPADGAVSYASAGHPASLVIAAAGTASFLPGTGEGPPATGVAHTGHRGLVPGGRHRAAVHRRHRRHRLDLAALPHRTDPPQTTDRTR